MFWGRTEQKVQLTKIQKPNFLPGPQNVSSFRVVLTRPKHTLIKYLRNLSCCFYRTSLFYHYIVAHYLIPNSENCQLVQNIICPRSNIKIMIFSLCKHLESIKWHQSNGMESSKTFELSRKNCCHLNSLCYTYFRMKCMKS